MNAFFIEIAAQQGWLNAEQVAAVQQALAENPSLSACDFFLQQEWMGVEHVAWLQQAAALQLAAEETTPSPVDSAPGPSAPGKRTSQHRLSKETISKLPPLPDKQGKVTRRGLEKAAPMLSVSQFLADHQIQGGLDSVADAQDSPPDQKRESLKYRIQNLVAQGGQGVIFNAEDANLQRTVAMKVLPAGHDRNLILPFIKEARITGQLSHPNIVPIHELGVEGKDCLYYTMKYVDGIDLDRILEQIRAGDKATIARYPLAQLLTIFQKVCDAMAFAHSKGIVHLDLKPSNVMVGEYGEVLVMDWGLAKVLSPNLPAESTPSHSGKTTSSQGIQIAGTLGFMAPEQASGSFNEIDARTDIYALGGILYNILTFETPIDGNDWQDMIPKIISGDIRSPFSFNPTASKKAPESQDPASAPDGRPVHCPNQVIPESLSAVAMKALSLKREARYQTVKELQKDVESYQQGFATSAEGAGMLKQLKLLLHRHKKETSLVAAGLAVLFVVIVGFIARLSMERNWALTEKKRAEMNEKLAKANEKRVIDADQERMKTLQALAAANAERAKAAELAAKANEERVRESEARLNALNLLAKTEKRAVENEALAKMNEQRAKESEKREAAIERAPLEQLEIVPETAKAFYQQAGSFLDTKKPEKALEAINHALKVAPKGADYYNLKGNILQTLLSFKEANEAYQQALRLNRNQKGAAENVLLCEKFIKETESGKPLSPTSLLELQAAMQLQDRYSEAMIISPQLGNSKKVLLSWWSAKLDKDGILKLLQEKKRSLHQDEQGLFKLDLSDLAVSSLKPLTGMPLAELHLNNTRINDLSPLKDMPLNVLQLNNTPVTDLGPLKGMSLIHLSAAGTKVTTLLPLKGLPLTYLRLGDTLINDLTPLKDMPLNHLDLSNTRVSDLTPLKGMPLTYVLLTDTPINNVSPLAEIPVETLSLTRCTKLQDLSPLAGCKTLKRLGIPLQGKKVQSLRNLPNLEYLDYVFHENKTMLTTDKFWKKYFP